MKKFIKVDEISEKEIIQQWDSLAPIRDGQLRSNKDISFNKIIKPFILDQIKNIDTTSVLDFGCGTGVLTEIIAEQSKSVTGFDLSHKSLEIAKNSTRIKANINYTSTLNNHINLNPLFTTTIANMVMQDVIDLESSITTIANLSEPDSHFIFTITHPWFWPMYWNYHKEPWFNYSQEIAIQAPFKITNEINVTEETVHFHRPLHKYTNTLSKCGFTMKSIHELLPIDMDDNYHAMWEYPRFIAIISQKKT